MFYNRKAIQKRIILEKFKGEDVDPTLYTGRYGDDVESAENNYYDNYRIYWPDYSEQPKWTREEANHFDDNPKYNKGGGMYGRAKKYMEEFIEKYGENWKEIAEKEIRQYYTQYGKRIAAVLKQDKDKEEYMKTKYPKKYQQMIDDIEGDKFRAAIYKKSTLGTNDELERELEQCREYVKNARHYILTDVGWRAIHAIEQGTRMSKWGEAVYKHESENREKEVLESAAYYVWSKFLKRMRAAGLTSPKILGQALSRAKTITEMVEALPKEWKNINIRQLRSIFGQWCNFFKSFGWKLTKGRDKIDWISDFVDFVRVSDKALFVLGKRIEVENPDFTKILKNDLADEMDEAISKADDRWKNRHPEMKNVTTVHNPFRGIAEITSQVVRFR